VSSVLAAGLGLGSLVTFVLTLPIFTVFPLALLKLYARLFGEWGASNRGLTTLPYQILLGGLLLICLWLAGLNWRRVRLQNVAAPSITSTSDIIHLAKTSPGKLATVAFELPALQPIGKPSGSAGGGKTRNGDDKQSYYVWPLDTGKQTTKAPHVWLASNSREPDLPGWYWKSGESIPFGYSDGQYFHAAIIDALDGKDVPEPLIVLEPIRNPREELAATNWLLQTALLWCNCGPLIVLGIWIAFGWLPKQLGNTDSKPAA
jgi:hypothetical protein